MFERSIRLAGVSLAISIAGCGVQSVSQNSAAVVPETEPGDPLPSLTDEQLALFWQGRAEFEVSRSPSGGLGPVFIERSCVACHAEGGVGGSDDLLDANHFVERFATLNASGGYDNLAAIGGDVRQTQSIAGEAAGCDVLGEYVPAVATIHSFRNPLPMFGIGLVAAIPASAILAHAIDKGDGVFGRPNLDATGRPGRFGWKAQTNDLAPFNANAANATMGFTSSFVPTEILPQGQPTPAGCTNADLGASSPNDPSGAAILAITAWEVMLAPVEPRQHENGTRAHGEVLFHDIGCAKCHAPSFETGDFSLPLVGGGSLPIAAVSRKVVEPYSDLLLHDMGPELDDHVTMRQARGRDFRTAMLWGIHQRTRYLHDGRADNLHDAIALHGGEAEIIRDRYLALDDDDRRELRRFVQNL